MKNETKQSYNVLVPNNSKSQRPASESTGQTKWCGSLEAWHSSDDNTLLNITCRRSAFPCHLENTTHYYQPHFQVEQIKQTINQSTTLTKLNFCRVPSLVWFICSPSGFLKQKQAGAWVLWGGCWCHCAAAVKCLSPLTLLFIWKSLVSSNLGPLLTQNQISDLIISQKSIIGAKPILFL